MLVGIGGFSQDMNRVSAVPFAITQVFSHAV